MGLLQLFGDQVTRLKRKWSGPAATQQLADELANILGSDVPITVREPITIYNAMADGSPVFNIIGGGGGGLQVTSPGGTKTSYNNGGIVSAVKTTINGTPQTHTVVQSFSGPAVVGDQFGKDGTVSGMFTVLDGDQFADQKQSINDSLAMIESQQDGGLGGSPDSGGDGSGGGGGDDGGGNSLSLSALINNWVIYDEDQTPVRPNPPCKNGYFTVEIDGDLEQGKTGKGYLIQDGQKSPFKLNLDGAILSGDLSDGDRAMVISDCATGQLLVVGGGTSGFTGTVDLMWDFDITITIAECVMTIDVTKKRKTLEFKKGLLKTVTAADDETVEIVSSVGG